jgi:hypothetical protein
MTYNHGTNQQQRTTPNFVGRANAFLDHPAAMTVVLLVFAYAFKSQIGLVAAQRIHMYILR